MKNSVDVLIVGAGPVGLFLATALAREGLEVMLVDRMSERTFFTKALGITSRSLELFDDFGIVQDAVDAGTWLRGVSNYTDGQPGPTMEIADVLPFGSLSLAQFEVERLLESCLHRHGGKVNYGWTLVSFEETAADVRAELTGPDGATHSVEATYIVGCDGGRSLVRKSLGLDFAGGQFPQTFVLADLEIGWDLPRGRFYRFNWSGTPERPGNAVAAVPVAGSLTRYRLSSVLPDSMVHAGEGERPAAPTLDEIRAFMTPLLPAGTRLDHMHWSSVYRVSHRLVESYAKGRAFLAGDAAHLHPPVGGQGLNTGLQDGYNLAWKLALALRGRAAPGLLASYSDERRAVGLDLVQNTSRALNEALAQRSPLPGMRETQLLIAYRGSAIVRDERPGAQDALFGAGDRIPDAGGLRRPYVGQPFRLHERLGRGRHVLVGYVGADGAGLDALAGMRRLMEEALGSAASTVAILAKGAEPPLREDIAIITDAAGEFAEAFGAEPGLTLLARPDLYLGWIGETPDLAGLKAALALIARPPA